MSPTSSSGASSFPSNRSTITSTDSINDLSHRFDKATLQPRGRNPYTVPPSKLPDINSSHLSCRSMPSTNHSRLARQQRQSIARRPCTSAHFSKIRSLVEDMLSDDSSYYDASHSSSTSSSLFQHMPNQESVSSDPSLATNPSFRNVPSSETDESDSCGCSQPSCRHSKGGDLRQSIYKESTGKPNIVLKRIRVRRSFLKRKSLEQGKRCDR